MAALSKQGAPPSKARQYAWLGLGVVVVALVLGNLFGLTSNPAADRLKREVEARDQVRAKEGPPTAKEGPGRAAPDGPSATTTPPPPARPADDASPGAERPVPVPPPAPSLPVPAGLPERYETEVRRLLASLQSFSLEVEDALRSLPAVAASAPEERRREVRAFLLRRLEPFVLATGPHTGLALEAAAWILRDDPEVEPATAHRLLVEGAARRLAAAERSPDLTACVAFVAVTRGADRPFAVRALRRAAADVGLPLGVRVLAVQGLARDEMDAAILDLADRPDVHPALREAVSAASR